MARDQKTGQDSRGLRIMRSRLMAAAVTACFATSPYALPTNPSVVIGNASLNQAGNVLNVTNSNGAIINWNTFSIGASETVRFIQSSASSSVLNRVLSANPSVILGTLSSNGRVFLINPGGIYVGAGANINVAGFVASTLNITDANFLANKLQFDATPGAGSVVNQGSITTPSGGSVYLVAPNIGNEGLITTPQGETILAAGQTVTLLDTATPGVSVEITGAEGNATNLGEIVADAGRIGIAGMLVNNSGVIRADTVQVGKNGEIFLRASKNIVLEPGSLVSASGAAGGVHDGGKILIVADDTLDMRAGSTVRVDGGVDGGNGGSLELSGKEKIALNGEYTGRALKDGYQNGSLLLDPANITIGALGLTASVALPAHAGTGAGEVLATPDGSRLYIVRSAGATVNTNYVDVFDVGSNTVIASIPIFGGSPYIADAAISPDGNRLYLLKTNTTPGSIYVVDINPANAGTTYNTVITSYTAGTNNSNPRSIAVSADSSKLFTAHSNWICSTCPAPPPQVSVIDASTGSQTGLVEIAGNPSQILANPVTERLYVANQGQLQEIDTSSNTVITTTGIGANPEQMLSSADGSKLYFTYADRIETRDVATMTVLSTTPIGGDALSVNAAGTRAYVVGNGSATVVDLTTNTGIQSFSTGGTGNGGIAFNAGLNRFYSTASPTSILSVFDLGVGSDTTSGGIITHSDPGATLNLALSALNGAWTNVSLAATNNISINSPLATASLPTGGSFSLVAGNDVNISAAIGSASSRFLHDLTLTAGNEVNIYAPIYLGNNSLALVADASIPVQGIASNGIGNVNIRALSMPVRVDTQGAFSATGQNMNILGGRNTSVSVVTGGLFNLNLPGSFTLQGGQLSVPGGGTTNATASVQASALSITAGGTITIAGGDNGYASGSDIISGISATAAGNASATLAAASSVSLTAPTITVRGGDSNGAGACCNGEGGEAGTEQPALSPMPPSPPAPASA
jgi:filamentous hemagglutinin family protein